MSLTLEDIQALVITARVTNYSALPSVASATNRYYDVINDQGVSWIPGWLGGSFYPKGIYFSNGTTWEYKGAAPFQADQATVNAGTNNDQFVTALTLTNSTQLSNKVDKIPLSVDNSIVRFDGTASAIQDSNISITDNGAMVFPPRATQSYLRGLLQYDSDNESLSFYNNESDVFMQIGQEIWMRCRNTTGSTIPNGSAVYVNGSSLGLPTVALAQANSGSTTVCAGLTTHSIEDNTIGYVTVIGTVRGLDTSLLSTGNLFLSATTPGAVTNIAPTSPNYRYRIGFVTNVSSTIGTIQVTPTTAALGNGTADQMLAINASGNQEFINKPYDASGFRKTGTGTFKRYYSQAVNCTGLTTTTIGQNVIRYIPLIISKLCTISEIGIDISGAGTAGSKIKLAIYNTVNTLPTSLILDVGTIGDYNADSATIQFQSINVTLTPGLYMVALNTNSAGGATLRAVAVGGSPAVLGSPVTGGLQGTHYGAVSGGTYGAYASTAVTPDSVSTTQVPMILFYLSS